MLVARQFVVSGKVQGVFFRASTRQQALRCGIAGYAKNLASGEVEVVAVGPEDAIKQLHQWLHQGPPTARVDRVTVIEISADPEFANRFHIL